MSIRETNLSKTTQNQFLIISPEKKLQIGSYITIYLAYILLIYLEGGGISTLSGLNCSLPILGINSLDNYWEWITKTKFKLENKNQPWIEYTTLGQIIIPILGNLDITKLFCSVHN